MMYGFNTAVRGLLASQRSLYTTNHNINNANTKGYSRQQAAQRATNPFEIPGVGFQGTGTEIHNIQRVRDSFVDFKYWNESAPTGEWDVKKANLAEIEKMMGEPSNNSFRQYMDDFYTSLEDMSKNPSDVAFRQPVRENALAFTKHLNETAQRLENMKKDTEYDIEIKVDHVNSLSSQIAGLNRQIHLAEVSGKPANDLRDRRELLVDDLSTIVNVQVNESPDGKYNVSVGGITIVDHLHVNKMSFNEVDAKDGAGNDIKKFKLTWENGGDVKLRSGELKGLIDIFTGNGEDNTYRGVPYFEKKLNEFASGYADKFNSKHKEGFTSKGDQGIDFFVGSGAEPITAATITINQKILDDVSLIAAAGNKDGSAEDANNILELIEQRENKNFFGNDPGDKMSKGTPDDFIKSMLSSMAVDSLQAQRAYATQEIIQKNISTKRYSISGVSPNEEMADMVRFQHVYVASSKMISTMDALLDLTVNRLGLVGR